MSHALSILSKKITIVHLPNHVRPKVASVQERPSTFGHFTIGELQHILTTIQLHRFKDRHYFEFHGVRYIVTVYDPEPSQDESHSLRENPDETGIFSEEVPFETRREPRNLL